MNSSLDVILNCKLDQEYLKIVPKLELTEASKTQPQSSN